MSRAPLVPLQALAATASFAVTVALTVTQAAAAPAPVTPAVPAAVLTPATTAVPAAAPAPVTPAVPAAVLAPATTGVPAAVPTATTAAVVADTAAAAPAKPKVGGRIFRGSRASRHLVARAASRNPVDPVDAAWNKALETLASGHPGAAIVQLESVLTQRPRHDDARLLLGELLLDAGRPGQARDVLQNGYTVSPAAFGLPLARALLAAGERDAARELLRAMPEPLEGAAARTALLREAGCARTPDTGPCSPE